MKSLIAVTALTAAATAAAIATSGIHLLIKTFSFYFANLRKESLKQQLSLFRKLTLGIC
jgi:hypothetical protein